MVSDKPRHLGDQAINATIGLSAQQPKTLWHLYRHAKDPDISRHAHSLLLLAEGYTWDAITAVLFTSASTIARWQQRFRDAGLAGLAGQQPGRRCGCLGYWAVRLVRWLTESTPRRFGLLPSLWTCASAAFVLATYFSVAVSRETVRRWLHQADLVWRRPRPVLRRHDPQRRRKLRALRRLLRQLPADEVAVFQDEVDINLNPKIGSMWMRRGQQAEVATPGDNDKRYLAGSINWRTGTLWTTVGKQRNGTLLVEHVEQLRRRLRRYKKLHVICDNARLHRAATWKQVQEYLRRWGHRIVLHYVPLYASESNPMERLWWHWHDAITRNPTCQTIEELWDLVLRWLEAESPFEIEGSVYPKPKVA